VPWLIRASASSARDNLPRQSIQRVNLLSLLPSIRQRFFLLQCQQRQVLKQKLERDDQSARRHAVLPTSQQLNKRLIVLKRKWRRMTGLLERLWLRIGALHKQAHADGREALEQPQLTDPPAAMCHLLSPQIEPRQRLMSRGLIATWLERCRWC